ncbi:unnamed protein product [Clonostachys byssicola]|uniref:Xylanolytic transcriptional activator regulatory domain-containing protein n=1 Tax=Clonostachys byssicola TaxID=160290 RepID=A0A9N9UIR0_9HYPO|nr:unnamed protein product [Clonostachys byssicola]
MKRKPACDGCYKRKCDSPDPGVVPCNWCLHHDLSCTLQRVRGRKATSARDKRCIGGSRPLRPATTTQPLKTVSSSSSIRATSEAPHHTTPATPLGSPSCSGGVNDPPSFLDKTRAEYYVPIYLDGVHIGKATPGNRAIDLSEDGRKWIQSHTGESVSSILFETTDEVPRSSLPHEDADSMSKNLEKPLPPRDMVEGILGVFASSAGPLIFPMIDPILFKETLDLAYQVPGMTPEHVRWGAQACVWAFVAIIYLFRGRLGIQPPVDGDMCADTAQSLLVATSKDVNLATLQTSLLLHLYRISCSRLKDVLILGSISCRSVYALGAHKYYRIGPDTPGMAIQERYHRQLRILFWVSFIFDKDTAIRTGNPPQLTNDDCDLTMPDNYESVYSVLPDLEVDLRSQPWNKGRLVPHYTSDPQLSCLKYRVYNSLYAPDRSTKSDTQLLHDMRVLDDEIETWRMSLPERFRPALFISENRNQHITGEMKLLGNMRHVHLQLEYHHLMALIHRASERYPKNASLGSPSSESSQSHTAVKTSRDISVGASRSTLFYLKAAVKSLAEESFWALMIYPSSAVMTIFFNILRHPLDPQTKLDLEMLKAATLSFTQFHSRSLMRRGNKNELVLHGAAAEMLRLAECAVAKAERENGNHGSDIWP